MKRIFLLFCLTCLPAIASRQFRAYSDTLLGPPAGLPSTGTLSFWVNPQFNPGDDAFHTFFEQYNVAAGAYFQVLTGVSGTRHHALYAAWHNGTYASVASASALALNQNAWNHLVVTWVNGGSLTIYLNGAAVATSFYCPPIALTGTPQSIGNRSTGGSDARSQMADIGIWSRVLASWEIALLDNGTLPSAIPAGLFEEYDLSGASLSSQAGTGGALGTSGPITAADPPPAAPPSLSLVGPSSGFTGTTSGFFTLTATNLAANATVNLTDNGAGGAFTPPVVTLTGPNPFALFTYSPSIAGNAAISMTSNGATIPAPFAYTVQAAPIFPTLNTDSNNKTVRTGMDATYLITQSAPNGYPGGPPRLLLFNVPSAFALTVNGQDCGAGQTEVRYFNWRACGVSATGSYTLTVHTNGLAPGVYFFTAACSEQQVAKGFGVSLTLTVTN